MKVYLWILTLLGLVLAITGKDVSVVARDEGENLINPDAYLEEQQVILAHDVMFQFEGKISGENWRKEMKMYEKYFHGKFW